MLNKVLFIFSCTVFMLSSSLAVAGEARDKIYVNGEYFRTVPSGTDTCRYVRQQLDTDCHYIRQERINDYTVKQYVRVSRHAVPNNEDYTTDYPSSPRRENRGGINIYIQF